MIYNLLTINGSEITDAYSLDVVKSVGDNNSSSYFNAVIENVAGRNTDKYSVGQEVKVYADKDRGLWCDKSGLVTQFRFNQSGTYVYDTDMNYSGLVVGSCAITSGLIDNAIEFYGSGLLGKIGSIVIPNNENLQLSGTMTISMWVYPYSFDKRTNPYNKSYGGEGTITQELAGYWNFYHGFALPGGSFEAFSSVGSPQLNAWTLMNVVRDMELGSVYWYMNGSVTSEKKINLPIAATTADISLGGGYTGSTYYGKIDDFRLYNKALTGSEILEIYNSGLGTETICFINENKKIFTGLLEDIKFYGEAQTEKMEIGGRDYSARLMDRTVEPEVYTNLQAGSIVKDIITKYTDNITTDNVQITGSAISRISFNHMNVFDAIKKLADLTGQSFYVDINKDLHFEDKGTTSSGYTFDNTNISKADFKEQRDTIYNQIWVYGDRYLDGFKETFTAGSPLGGSIFTLLYKPSSTQITVAGSVIQPGAIEEMSFSIGSDVKYLVNYDEKRITFTSGTEQGDNIPASGASVVVNYQRGLPIVKVGENEASKTIYGTRVKVIQDKDIKDPVTAEAIMNKELDDNAFPKKQGTISLDGVLNIEAGQTAIVNLPNHEINNETYDIIEASYGFTPNNNTRDEVLRVKVNNKLPDVTDTLKDLISNLKKLQAGDMDQSDLITRFKFTTGSLGIRTSGLQVWTQPINDSFALSHPINGVLGEVSSFTGSITGSLAWVSGIMNEGYFPGESCGYALYNPGSWATSKVVIENPVSQVFSFGNTTTDQGGQMTGQLSLSFWANLLTGSSVYRHLIGKSQPGANEWAVRTTNNGTGSCVYNFYMFGNPDGTHSFSHYVYANNDQWNHFVFAGSYIQPTGAIIWGYLNNNLIGSAVNLGYTEPLGPARNAPLQFFSRSTDATVPGYLDDIRIYNKVLSGTEIGSLYSKVNYKPNLVAYYKFDEGTGSFAYNSASVEMPTEDSVLHFRLNKSGTTIVDEVAGYIGSNVRGANWYTGVYGNGSSMITSGTNYFQVYIDPSGVGGAPNYPELIFTKDTPFSIGTWINVFGGSWASNSTTGIFGRGATSSCNYAIDSISGTTPTFRFGVRSGTFSMVINSPNCDYNKWHNIVGTYNGSNLLNMYINGSTIGSYFTNGSGFYSGLSDLNVGFGAIINGNNGSFIRYYIDEPRIWNRELSQVEALRLFEGKTIQPLLGDRRGGSTLIWSGGYPGG